VNTAVVRESYDVAGGLARSYMFEGITTEELEPLVAVVTTRRLVRGEILLRAGDPAHEIYVVLTGELKDFVVDAAGVEVVHFLHGPGMTIGEPAFFAVDHRRVVEVIAVAPSVVIRLGRREFEPYIASHPSIKDRVLERLASDTRWQTTMISSLLSRSLTDRLVLRLLELVDSNPERRATLSITPKISQSTLAAMVGVSRENVNRALSALSAAGSIRQENGRYVRAGGRAAAPPGVGQGLAARSASRPSVPAAAGRDRCVVTAHPGCDTTA
jgi:CRP/FNR family transcriptional regulator, cyclic AMP receptor protein